MAQKPKSYRAPKKGSSNALWISVVSVIVVVGVVLIVVSRGSKDTPDSNVPPLARTATQQGDHWHVALGVNVCGSWLPNIPTFEERAGTSAIAGIHSHGDGLLHIHPNVPDEAGENATIGKFLDFAGVTINEDEISWTDGTEKSAGDSCEKGGDEAVIRWTHFNNDDEDKTAEIGEGDVEDYKPDADDVVSVFYGPKSDDIVKLSADNPNIQMLAAPSDAEPTDTAATSAPADTTASTGASTDTTPSSTPASGTSSTTATAPTSSTTP